MYIPKLMPRGGSVRMPEAGAQIRGGAGEPADVDWGTENTRTYNPYDSLNFKQAWKLARHTEGPAGVFEWQGKKFSTANEQERPDLARKQNVAAGVTSGGRTSGREDFSDVVSQATASRAASSVPGVYDVGTPWRAKEAPQEPFSLRAPDEPYGPQLPYGPSMPYDVGFPWRKSPMTPKSGPYEMPEVVSIGQRPDEGILGGQTFDNSMQPRPEMKFLQMLDSLLRRK